MSVKKLRILVVLTVIVLLTGAMSALAQNDNKLIFMSTQFNTVEESEKARAILANFSGNVEFVGSDEAPLIDLLRAENQSGQGTVGVIGALHGTFPVLVNEDLLVDLTDLLTSIEAENDIADAFVQLGKMGTEDYQYYIPWMQATYIMAANKEALQYLPEGVDINALTWEQLRDWAKAVYDATGEAKLGFANAGLFHRFLEGYIFPSFTGGMVTGFKSPEAVQMFDFLKDLWQYVHPQWINYEFMQEPLLSGEVWIAFDHTARLKQAFDERPDDFVAFPAPAGPAGRGFMPVVVGLAIPYTSPDPEAAQNFIRFMLSPDTQAQVLSDLGFFPVVAGVDTTNLPQGVGIEQAAVSAQATSSDALPALLPVGLGDRGGEINEIYRNAFNRIVIDGEDAQTVLNEEGATLQALLNDTGAACWPPDAPSEGACQLK